MNAQEVIGPLFERATAVDRFRLNYASPELHMAHGALVALQGIGALDDEAARAWLKRLAVEAERVRGLPGVEEVRERMQAGPSAPTSPPEMCKKAVQHLDRLLKAAEMFRSLGSAESSTALVELAARGSGAVEAFRLAGLLDCEDDKWTRRFIEVARPYDDEIRMMLPPKVQEAPRLTAKCEAAPAGVMAAASDTRPPSLFTGARLTRVLLIEPQETNAVIPLTLEIFDDGIVASYLVARERTRSPRNGAAGRVEMRDGMGTDYRYLGGGGGNRGSNAFIRHEATFVPCPPDDVDELHLILDGDLWRLPLS
jgi:hypothetical protein